MKYEVKDLNPPSRWNMRIWDDNRKEWLCQSDEEALTYYGFDITGGETTEFQGLPKWHPDRHLIWEQSTGLKDKNSKEIYEGDIVKMPDWQVKPKYEEVRFVKLSCGFEPFVRGCFDCMAPDGEEVEIIGNVHENPELLEGER